MFIEPRYPGTQQAPLGAQYESFISLLRSLLLFYYDWAMNISLLAERKAPTLATAIRQNCGSSTAQS